MFISIYDFMVMTGGWFVVVLAHGRNSDPMVAYKFLQMGWGGVGMLTFMLCSYADDVALKVGWGGDANVHGTQMMLR